MPADETTTQVAGASGSADTDAAQDEQALASQELAAEANGAATPEPDLKAELEKATAELVQERSARVAAEKRALDTDNLVRTQAGAQSATDRRLNAIDVRLQRAEETRAAERISDDEVARVRTAHAADDQVSFASFTAEQRNGIVSALSAAGLQASDVDHEELADARDLWVMAYNANDRAGIERSVKSAMRAIKRLQAAKPTPTPLPSKPESEEKKGAANRHLANMDTGGGLGAANASITTLMGRYGEDYDSLTQAQRKQVEDHMRREGLI